MSLAAYYMARIRVAWQVQMQYRLALMIWMIWLIAEPVVHLSVWSAVADSQGGMVGGWAPRDFAGYYIVLLAVNHFTQDWHMWEYEYLVREGLLSQRLLHPLHPIHRDASENIAYKLLMLMVLVPVLIAFAWLFHPRLSPEPWAIAAFIPALLLAALLFFQLCWSLALAAFWITRTQAINGLYFTLVLFFSGQIAPLDLLPVWLRTIADWTPFPYVAAFPAELLMGRIGPQEALRDFAFQLGWIGITLFILLRFWKAAARHYSAVGG